MKKTIVFADLSGFTALTEVHGDKDAAELVSRYIEMVQGVLPEQTRVVKTIGDEVMVVADNAVQGIHGAVNISKAVKTEPQFPGVRIGCHHGDVIRQEDDYFGNAVNLAARVASQALPEQILCTEPVKEAGEDIPELELVSAGRATFKNISGHVDLYEITIQKENTPDRSPTRCAGCS
ncbi:MAG: adenylate/guanylate cyclase domain-containing protein [bacterium]